MSLPSGHRKHQTAVVIDVRNGASPAFVNRYTRLLQSLNGQNIKADIYTLRGNATSDGPGLVFGTPDEFVSPDQPAQEIDLQEWANEQGYTMLLVAVPTA